MTAAGPAASVRASLEKARSILAVTGAGISAESGLRTFRGQDGWWRNHRAEELATLEAFHRDPRTVWEWYESRRADAARAEPNRAHVALASWENSGTRVFVLTQNVDDLHERAGASEVVHIHGSIWRVRCLSCGRVYDNRTVPFPQLPPCCPCGGILRPDVVWFGEELPLEAVVRIEDFLNAGQIDLAFVIGTEASFDYIRDWALRARRAGALLVEVNISETALTPEVDFHLRGKAGDVLPSLSRGALR